MSLTITNGPILTKTAKEHLTIGGILAAAFILALAFAPASSEATISDEEALGYVMEAHQVLAAREENPGAVLVGVGCGPGRDEIILAAEESDFLFNCQAIEAHYLPEGV